MQNKLNELDNKIIENLEKQVAIFESIIDINSKTIDRYKTALEQIQTCIKNGSVQTQFMDLVIINEIANQALGQKE